MAYLLAYAVSRMATMKLLYHTPANAKTSPTLSMEFKERVMAIECGDTVVFKGSVIARCGHSKNIVGYRGVAKEVSNGLCLVESAGQTKWIPVANLSSIKSVYDHRLQRTVAVLLDIQ